VVGGTDGARTVRAVVGTLACELVLVLCGFVSARTLLFAPFAETNHIVWVGVLGTSAASILAIPALWRARRAPNYSAATP
jgi:hypothetical protein